MMIRNRTFRIAALVMGAAFLWSGCATYVAPYSTKPAHPGIKSTVEGEMAALPAPKEKIVVAVYRFRDQTGQYKPSEAVASWSTAVTQGATSILVRALEESNWFVPIEREGLSNLLNERQIIQSTRAQHEGPQGQALGPLPPLLYAGVLLEGGIIGYDTNVITNGAGVRYFGTGASGQFRQDQVTIYLRAVATQTGRVLKTVHTTKTIVSQKLDGGIFRYVDTNRILEAEAGYTYNEPPVLAVTEAIDEAVKNLIVEGIRENLWEPATPYDAQAPVFQEYDHEVERVAAMDYFGRTEQRNRPGVGLGFGVGALQIQGDYKNPLTRPMGDVHLRFGLGRYLGLSFAGSAGTVGAQDAFTSAHYAGDATLLYYLLPDSPVTPFLQAGTGVLVQSKTNPAVSDGTFPYVTAAAGVEMMLSQRVGLSLSLGNDYALVEGLDGVRMGRIHDNVWRLRSGLTFYTGRRR